MARLKRFCPAGQAVHIIQRGNDRRACFASKEDFATYASYLRHYAEQFDVAVHAWILMTNHVHLLATPNKQEGISLMMQGIGRRYVRYFNHRYERTGTLWEGRFKSGLVDSEAYLLKVYRYIELNPVRAGMVSDPSEYHWSSYGSNALGKYSSILTTHPVYDGLGLHAIPRRAAYKALFEKQLSQPELTAIRKAVNKGLALGADQFKNEIERLYQRRVTAKKAGRPAKI